MRRSVYYSLIILTLILTVACESDEEENVIPPVTEILKNDGFTDGGNVVFQGGFLNTEEAAVILGPVSGSATLNKILLLFGGGTDGVDRNIRLSLFKDGGAGVPGAGILTNKLVTLTSSSDAFREIDLSAENIALQDGDSFWVVVRFTADGFPCIARDDDGNIFTDRNFVKALGSGGTWQSSSDLGLSGDFVIRAEIEK